MSESHWQVVHVVRRGDGLLLFPGNAFLLLALVALRNNLKEIGIIKRQGLAILQVARQVVYDAEVAPLRDFLEEVEVLDLLFKRLHAWNGGGVKRGLLGGRGGCKFSGPFRLAG